MSPPSAAARIEASVRSGAAHLSTAACCAATSPSGQRPSAMAAASASALHARQCGLWRGQSSFWHAAPQ